MVKIIVGMWIEYIEGESEDALVLNNTTREV